jgi:hypothetical protein
VILAPWEGSVTRHNGVALLAGGDVIPGFYYKTKYSSYA